MTMARNDGGAGHRVRRSLRGLACGAVAVGLVAAQLPAPAAAGAFDPGRVRHLAGAGATPVLGRSLAAGVRIRLPFQAVHRDASPLRETRVAFGLGLRAPSALGARPGLPAGGYHRPLLRLSFAFTGRADALRLNGLPLVAPDAFHAEGEDASADEREKKHRSRKWWWIGGAVVVGVVAAIAAAGNPGNIDIGQGS